jgi:hypothetical protein
MKSAQDGASPDHTGSLNRARNGRIRVLAGMSAGYVLSVVLANAMLATADYRLAFTVTAGIAVVGSALSITATWTLRK